MEILKQDFTCLRDGLTIRGTEYRPQGEKLPIVLLSHGFLAIGNDIAYYAEQLAAWGYAAYVYDFCGGSPRSHSDGSFTDMTPFTEVQDLAAIMDYVCSLPYTDESDLTLMGCSQGGFVSGLAAAAYPDRVTRVVEFFPALCIPEDARKGSMMMFRFDPDNIPDEIHPELPPDLPKDLPFKMEPLGGCFPRSVRHMDAFSVLAPYPGPVLIVHGDRDPIVDVANAYRAQTAYNAVVPRRCQLAVITGADHGFKGQQDVHAMELVHEFLRGRTNVISVDVTVTDCIREEAEGETRITLPFGGTVSTPFFSGMVEPGSADVQRWQGDKPIRLCADYVVRGTDYTGRECRLHIVNEDTGSGWKPTVTTDSEALSFLNGADLTESLEMRRTGPVVRIFAKL